MPDPGSGCGLTEGLVAGHLERKTAPAYQPYPGHLGKLYINKRKQLVANKGEKWCHSNHSLEQDQRKMLFQMTAKWKWKLLPMCA